RGCVFSVPCAPPAPACTDAAPGLCVPSTSQDSCSFEWLVFPDMRNRPANVPSRTIACADGQPFCDVDGAQDGKCTFHVAACINNQAPRRFCTPTSVRTIDLRHPSVASADATDTANAAALLAALKDIDGGSAGTVSGSQVSYSPAAATTNACTNYLTIT